MNVGCCGFGRYSFGCCGFGCPSFGCFDFGCCEYSLWRRFWMLFGGYEHWLLWFWTLRKLDATLLDALIATRSHRSANDVTRGAVHSAQRANRISGRAAHRSGPAIHTGVQTKADCLLTSPWWVLGKRLYSATGGVPIYYHLGCFNHINRTWLTEGFKR